MKKLKLLDFKCKYATVLKFTTLKQDEKLEMSYKVGLIFWFG